MKKIITLLVLLVLFSCDAFKPKQEHRFIYAFQNETEVSGIDIVKSIEVLKKRLSDYGIQNEVKRFGEKGVEIVVRAAELDVDRLDKLISNEGKLEFWELYNGNEIYPYIGELFRDIEETTSEGLQFKSKFEISFPYGGPAIIYVGQQDKDTIAHLINSKVNRLKLPVEHKNVKFLWGRADEGRFPLYAAKSNREDKAPLTGEVITNASQIFGVIGNPEVSMQMNQKGAVIWERLTSRAFQNNTCIAITMNNIVYSAPGVTVGGIKGGNSSVSGDFTVEEAQDLAIVLASGQKIPKLKQVEYTTVNR